MELDLNVDFEISTNKVDKVLKSTMKKVCEFLFEVWKKERKNLTVFLRDTNNKVWCFCFSRCSKCSLYDFEVSYCSLEGEGNTSKEVSSCYYVDYKNGQHRELDYKNATMDYYID